MVKQDITHISQETERTAQECEENVKMTSPTYKEISNIVDKLKCNKSPSPDNIIPEFIKYGGTSLKKRIHCLICKIWENEALPDEWLKGIICPVFKKGDPKQCKNYRAITLLNIVYKVFSTYLYNKLSEIIGNKISENQTGFRQNRSTIDNIHIVRQIYEKSHEYNIELHNLFIDYTQAFDTVHRTAVIKSLKQFGIPIKLQNVITLTLQNTTAQVRINNDLTEATDINTGVRQGYPLSTLLFSMVLDTVIKNLDITGNTSMRLRQICAYADDPIILARTRQAMMDTFTKLKNEAIESGLVVNVAKTKYMKCSRSTSIETYINIEDTQFEKTKAFKYFGSIVNEDNSIEQEVQERIAAGNHAYVANKIMLTSKQLSRKVKLTLYRTIVRPVITYACETWTLKDKIEQKLTVFERKILRKIFGPIKVSEDRWRIRTNDELNTLINHTNIVRYVKAQRISGLGHIERMPDDGTVKKITNWKPTAPRHIGRPKLRWEEDVRNDLKAMKVQNWKKLTQDRNKWKGIIE
jgi:hypothetical protein